MIRKLTIFNRNQSDPSSDYSPRRVFSTAFHQTLLAPQQRKALLQAIRKQAKAPDKYFKALYLPLIEHFADYVQALPEIGTFNTEHAAEWLDTALARAAYALTIRHRMVLPFGASPEQAETDYPLWTYVVFSSSLLWQIGKLSSHYTIALCDAKGVVSGNWNPMSGSLAHASTHYKVRNIDKNGSDSFIHLTPVIAQKLMPADGFRWISSDETALEQWLSALVNEDGASGNVGQVLSLANNILIDNVNRNDWVPHLMLLEEQIRQLDSDINAIDSIAKALREDPTLPPVQITEPPDTQAGELFFEWLKKGILNQNIPINDTNAHVHITKEGVVLAYPEIFQDFCREFPRFKDWVVVYKQFNALGLTKMSGGDTWFGKFFAEKEPDTPNPSPGQSRYGLGSHFSRSLLASTTTGPAQSPSTNQPNTNSLVQAQNRQRQHQLSYNNNILRRQAHAYQSPTNIQSIQNSSSHANDRRHHPIQHIMRPPPGQAQEISAFKAIMLENHRAIYGSHQPDLNQTLQKQTQKDIQQRYPVLTQRLSHKIT